jgi:DNA-binding Lrp family transcriptional regulator
MRHRKGEGYEVKLDKKDLQILKLLSRDCRKTTYNIGERVGLNADSVAYRIKRMINSNVIRKFTILPNISALEYHWYTYCLRLNSFTLKDDQKVKEFVLQHPSLLRAVKVLGNWDLMLYICSQGPTFHALVKEIKNTFADIIRSYETWIAYKEHYFNPFPEAVHLRNLFSQRKIYKS